jgi:hypothetical protein
MAMIRKAPAPAAAGGRHSALSAVSPAPVPAAAPTLRRGGGSRPRSGALRRLRTSNAAVSLGAVGTAVAMTAVLVGQTSSAAFSATTSNTGDNWAAGSVALTDNDAGGAMFATATDGSLRATQVLTKCIRVTYGGTLVTNDPVRFYVKNVAGTGLAAYLSVQVQTGSGTSSAFSGCTGFVASGTDLVAAGTKLNAITAATFATGVPTTGAANEWKPAVNGETRDYKIIVTVDDNNAAQGLTASGEFWWEVQAL